MNKKRLWILGSRAFFNSDSDIGIPPVCDSEQFTRSQFHLRVLMDLIIDLVVPETPHRICLLCFLLHVDTSR